MPVNLHRDVQTPWPFCRLRRSEGSLCVLRLVRPNQDALNRQFIIVVRSKTMRKKTKVALGLGLLSICGIASWWLFFSSAYDGQPDRKAPLADQARSVRSPLAETPASLDRPIDPITPSGPRTLSTTGQPVSAPSPRGSFGQTGNVAVKSPPGAPNPSGPGVQPAPPAPDVSERQKEIAGTHYMIMAHAPLRVPEVADPDSTPNREILHSMMTKALARERADALPSAN